MPPVMLDYSKMNMSELIAARAANNEALREANKIVTQYADEEDAIDAAIIIKMEADGTKRAASDQGSVSVQVTDEPTVDDWDKLYEHILANKDFGLLHRRVSATAFRELLKAGTPPPGTSARQVKRVNFRSA